MHLWERFKSRLEQRLGTNAFTQWVAPLTVVRFDARNVTLEAPSDFHKVWFDEHVKPWAEKILVNENGQHIAIHMHITGTSDDDTTVDQLLCNTPSHTTPSPLHPHFTEKNWIEQPANALANRLLTDRLPTEACNPIYLYGPPGCGKTHWVYAYTAQWHQQGKRFRMTHAETFASHMIRAIRQGSMQTFRDYYRDGEGLIIEGIEALARKFATQEEFFYTFNTLYNSTHPIIITSSLPTHALKGVEERLISRFQWGITIPLSPLEGAPLLHWIELQAQRHHLHLEKEAVTLLYEHLGHHIHWLIAAMQTLALDLPLKKKGTITKEDCQVVLHDFFERAAAKILTSSTIIVQIAQHFGITEEKLLGTSRAKECVVPRQIAMWLCRKWLTLSFHQIGRLFQRDHSTVVSATQRAQIHLKKDPALYRQLLQTFDGWQRVDSIQKID